MTILQWSKQGSQLEVDEPSSPPSQHGGLDEACTVGAGISAARLLAMEIELATFALLHIAHHLQGSPPPCEGERHTKKLGCGELLNFASRQEHLTRELPNRPVQK